MSNRNTAKQEIADFLASNDAGVESQFSRATLVNAAQNMFTAQGVDSPVYFAERDGVAYILKRSAIADATQ